MKIIRALSVRLWNLKWPYRFEHYGLPVLRPFNNLKVFLSKPGWPQDLATYTRNPYLMACSNTTAPLYHPIPNYLHQRLSNPSLAFVSSHQYKHDPRNCLPNQSGGSPQEAYRNILSPHSLNRHNVLHRGFIMWYSIHTSSYYIAKNK